MPVFVLYHQPYHCMVRLSLGCSIPALGLARYGLWIAGDGAFLGWEVQQVDWMVLIYPVITSLGVSASKESNFQQEAMKLDKQRTRCRRIPVSFLLQALGQ